MDTGGADVFAAPLTPCEVRDAAAGLYELHPVEPFKSDDDHLFLFTC